MEDILSKSGFVGIDDPAYQNAAKAYNAMKAELTAHFVCIIPG